LASTRSVSWMHTILEEGRPVSMIRYAEGLISVPLLLVLSGCCAMRRPLREVATPIMVTQAYMVVSWAALLVSSVILRWAMVLTAFIGYGWASGGMLGWVLGFLQDSPSRAPCRRLRISSVIMLIVFLAMHGVNYLLAIFKVVGPQVEQITYAVLGFSGMVLTSMVFAAIRVMENRHETGRLLCRVHGVSTAFMSLLRGNFDFVMPCLVGSNGICQLPVSNECDIHELEQRLGRAVSGVTLNELLAGVLEKRRFGAYVKNVLNQGANLQCCESTDREELMGHIGCNHSNSPQIAHVLHVRLERMPATLLAQVEGGADDASDMYVDAFVYLSPELEAHSQENARQHMVMGLRLASKAHVPIKSSLARAIQAPPEPCAQDAVNGEGSWGARGRLTPIKAVLSPNGTLSTVADSNDKYSEPRNQASRPRLAWKREGKRSGRAGKWLGSGRGKRMKELPTKQRAQEKQKASAPAESEKSTGSPHGQDEVDALVDPFAGAWDACSQSSRMSCVGSVTIACRQLLGPLHDQLPPPQLVSKRVEDHVQCAAEMVRMRACAKISGLHYEQQLEEWHRRKSSHVVGTLLGRGKAPETGIDEQVWRSELLPHLQEAPPGRRPREPDLPDDTELWYRAWQHTYEEEDSSEDGSESSSPDSGDSEEAVGPILLGRAHQPRLTARTDPRMGQQ